MIRIICGGIGSGKTTAAVKDLIDRRQKAYTNFHVRHDKDVTRLKYEHLFITDPVDKKLKLNFSFWTDSLKKYGGFDIVLDEFHNVMSSRRSMSKRNVLLSDWLSQIRKVLGSSEHNDLVIITQKIRRVDVNVRDLAHEVVFCNKLVFDTLIPTEVYENGRKLIKNLPLTMIYKYYFYDVDDFALWKDTGIKKYFKVTRFVANWYYKFFDSYELIDFGGEDYV